MEKDKIRQHRYRVDTLLTDITKIRFKHQSAGTSIFGIIESRDPF